MAQSIIEEIGHILPPSGNLAETLARAADYATQQAHTEVTLEHLLLALTEDPDAARVLAASAVQVEQLKGDVSSHLGRLEDHSAAGGTAGISADLRQILEAAAAAARGRRDTAGGHEDGKRPYQQPSATASGEPRAVVAGAGEPGQRHVLQNATPWHVCAHLRSARRRGHAFYTIFGHGP